jgi:Right handed beta helix region
MRRRDVVAAAMGLSVAETASTARSAASEPAVAAGRGNGAALTALERAAGVSSVDPSFIPGDVRRYGADGQGRTDDSGAWRSAVSTGHLVVGGGPTQLYRLDAHVPIKRATLIDLQGATVKISGNTQAFVHNPGPPTATSDAGGATQGSRSLNLAAPQGFAVGQWLRITYNDYPAHDASSYPPSWARIVEIRGRVADLDTPLQVTYGRGNAQAMAYGPGALIPRFECKNGIFDGSDCTWDRDTGQALRIGGFEYAAVRDCEFRNFRFAGKLTCAVELFVGVDVRVSGCRFTGGISNFDMCDLQEARSAHFTDNVLDGSHFGCNITRVDYGLFANNSVHGQRRREADEGLAVPRSARGLKAYGCTAIRVLGNHVSDYESPIKIDACFRYDVSHNTIFNAGLAPYNGQIALNVGSIIHGRNMGCGRIIGNHVENCGGIGIGVTSDPAGGVIISGNIVRTAQCAGILVAVSGATITANRIEDWGLLGRGDAGIRFGNGATVADNRFANAAMPSAPCLASQDSGDGNQVLRDNVSETRNPLI